MSRAGRVAAAALAASLGAATAPGTAQLPNASAAALGLGENYTAAARGFAAVSWNPAGLGLPDNPQSSFALMAVRGVTGLDPVGPGDLAEFQGEALPDAVKAEWLGRIVEEGSQRGEAAAGLTYLAASAGRFAVHLSSSADVLADIGPEAAELLLYGNAGRSGEPRDFELSDASLDLTVSSTVAAAYGQPVVRRPGSVISVGAAVKYTVGHVLVTARDEGSELTADPLELRLRFPVVQTDTSFSRDELGNGSGVGLDVGVAWSGPRHAVAAVVQNLVNTFEWDESRLFHRAGEAMFTGDDSGSEFSPQPFETAPAALREHVEDLRYRPVIGVGATYRLRPDVRLVADVRRRTSGSDLHGPATHVGVGAELTPVRWIAARVGVAGLSGGYLLSGGLGLALGVVELGASVAARDTDLGTGTVAMFTFSSGGR